MHRIAGSLSVDSSSGDMISLSEDFEICRPADEVWPLLSNPELVASCIPGATLDKQGADGRHLGTIKVKFGPTVVQFRGEVDLAYDHAHRCCTIRGRGVDQRGQSRANASGTLSITGTDVTKGRLQGGFILTGPLENFARTGGVHVARALLAEFVINVTRLAEQRGMTEAASTVSRRPSAAGAHDARIETHLPPAVTTSAATLSGFKIVRRALLGWLRSLFQT